MADCDLCTVAIPTVCPVRVFSPKFEQSYPEGIWKGLCGDCLDRAKEAYDRVNGDTPELGVFGKCDLCGSGTQLYEVGVKIPSFSKGYEDETKHICMSCLEKCSQAHASKDELLGEH